MVQILWGNLPLLYDATHSEGMGEEANSAENRCFLGPRRGRRRGRSYSLTAEPPGLKNNE